MVTGLGFAISMLPIFGWIGLILKIGFMCMAYMALLWFCGVNKYEKDLLISLFNLKKYIRH